LRGSAVPYFKKLDPVVAAFCEPGIGVLSGRAWMFEKQTGFFGSAMHSDHISSIGVKIKKVRVHGNGLRDCGAPITS
jgi:hypothetical protein